MSSDNSPLLLVLPQLALQLPTLIVWVVAAVFALLRWERHPRASLYLLIAVGIFFVERLVGTWISMIMPLRLRERGLSHADMGIWFATWGVARSLVDAGGWTLMVLALFGVRQAEARRR